MKHAGLLAAAAAAGLAFATPALADPYQFTITGDYNASFVLDSNPTPDDYADGLYFTLFDVEGFPDALLGVADLYFFNSDFGGGLEADDFYAGSVLIATDGPQLYTGSESNPTFLTGTFDLTQFNGPGTYTLTIAAVDAAVPEPATWGLMILGFGAVGATMRRRSTKVAFAA